MEMLYLKKYRYRNTQPTASCIFPVLCSKKPENIVLYFEACTTLSYETLNFSVFYASANTGTPIVPW